MNQDGRGCKPLIHARNAPHSGVMGEGSIDGQGGERLLHQSKSWWDLAHQAKVENARQNCPRLLVVDSSNDFTLYGIALRNSPNFHVIVSKTDGFTAWGVRIDAPANARNTDGIDPSSSTALKGSSRSFQILRVAGQRLVRSQALATSIMARPRGITESVATFLQQALSDGR